MHTSLAALTIVAAFFGGCVDVAPPPNRSSPDPSDPSAPEASARRFRPNLVATTHVYLDPSVGRGAQKMDHSEMPGMGAKQPTAGASPAQPGPMQGMENKQPGGTPPPAPRGEMQGMDHSKMPGMGAKPPSAEPPPSKEALDTEMKKTSDEMKRLSDELKAKSDAAKDTEKPGHKPPAVAASPTVSYTCPMHPEVQQPKPGKCPKCGMTLVQKEAPRKEEKK